MITLSKLDENYIYIEYKEVDKFSTWTKEWVESLPPTLVDGKFYKFMSKNNWEELTAYPKDISKPSKFHVWDEIKGNWVEDTNLKEKKRVSLIIDKADEIIYAAFPQKKQNKLFSIIAFLQDKQNLGQSLTSNEERKLQEMRDVNVWITAIRTIENTAIADKTLFEDIDWTVA